MADFNTGDFGGPTGSPVQPQQAVVDTSSVQTLQNVGRAVGALFGAGGIGDALAAEKKAKMAQQQGEVMSGYAQKVTGLNAAVEQGNISWAEAKRRQRAYYNQTVANFPSLTEDITKFHSEIASAKGLGDVLAQGSAVDQQIQADTKEATAAGFIQPSMTTEQQQAGLNSFREQQHAINQMDFYGKQLEIQSKKMSITAQAESIAASRANRQNALLDIQMKRNKQNVQSGTADVANSYLQKTLGALDSIQKQVQDGKMSQQDALAQTNQLKNELFAVTQPIRGAAGADYVDGLQKPILDVIAARENFLSGKVDAETSQNLIDAATAHAALPIMKDPKAAQILALSKLTGGVMGTQIMSQMGGYMVDLLKKNLGPTGVPGNVVPEDASDKVENKNYLKSVGVAINKLAQKDPTVIDPKGTMEEVSNHVNKILKGVNAFSMSVENPGQLNDVSNFLASKDFLQYQKMGGTIDASNTAAVKSIVSEQYNNKVIEAIRKEWENNKTVVGYPTQVRQVGPVTMPVPNDKETTQAVEYRWTGNSLTFVPAKGMERNRGAVAKAKELNQKAAPLINRLVRMNAHLDGSDNYSKYFQEEEQAIFGTVPETSSGG